MLNSVEGIYRDGKVEFLEKPPVNDDVPVIVTFLTPGGAIDLRTLAIDEPKAADLRARLSTFAEDWNRPEMDVYDER